MTCVDVIRHVEPTEMISFIDVAQSGNDMQRTRTETQPWATTQSTLPLANTNVEQTSSKVSS
jgi:hypothetical protein